MTILKRTDMDATQRRRALEAAQDLKQRLARVPSPYPDRAAYDAEIAQLTEALTTRQNARATINTRWDGASIAMLGFRASSTSGLVGACNNWIGQVRRKCEK